jgi:acetoin utilization deacetylase AcuC-like enzyme
MKTFYNPTFCGSEHQSETTQKAKHIAADIVVDPISGLEIVDPDPYTALVIEYINEIHDKKYVDAVRTGEPRHLATSQGFTWGPGLYPMAVAHNAGVLAATHEALTNNCTAGTLSSGLHHASYGRGCGFCTFNGLAAAALYAVNVFNAMRVLILDFDAHSGGGTWDIIQRTMPDNVVQIDVTTSPFDTWTPTGESILMYSDVEDYRQTIREAIEYAKTLKPFDFVIYNGGMDPINDGVSEDVISYRERAVREFIGDTPAIFTLAGGYTWGGQTYEDITAWHRMTLNTWAKAAMRNNK